MTLALAIPRRPTFWVSAGPVERAAMLLGALLILAALLAPWLTAFEPNAQSLILRLRPAHRGSTAPSPAIGWARTSWAAMC